VIWTVRGRDGVPVTVREQVEPDDQAGLLELFDACAEWFIDAFGHPSGPGDVQSLFYALPEGSTFEDKRLFVVHDAARVIGLVDAVLRHPDSRSCSVGVFLVHPEYRRRGLGTAIARVLAREADRGR
jgi:GNAT superfamily N-acetyltransferase